MIKLLYRQDYGTTSVRAHHHQSSVWAVTGWLCAGCGAADAGAEAPNTRPATSAIAAKVRVRKLRITTFLARFVPILLGVNALR